MELSAETKFLFIQAETKSIMIGAEKEIENKTIILKVCDTVHLKVNPDIFFFNEGMEGGGKRRGWGKGTNF